MNYVIIGYGGRGEVYSRILKNNKECGFSSLAYFNNLFKSRFNCTPAKYRNNKTV